MCTDGLFKFKKKLSRMGVACWDAVPLTTTAYVQFMLQLHIEITCLQAIMRERFPEHMDRVQYPLVAATLEFRA